MISHVPEQCSNIIGTCCCSSCLLINYGLEEAQRDGRWVPGNLSKEPILMIITDANSVNKVMLRIQI